MQQSSESLEIAAIRQATREIVRGLGLLHSESYGLGISVSQAHVLVEIDKGENVTSAHLCSVLNLDRSTMSRMIADLVQNGHIVEEGDETDKRLKRLHLTESGRKLADQVAENSRELVSEIVEHLNKEECDAVICGLELYAKAITRATALRDYSIRPIRPEDNKTLAKICRGVMLDFGVSGVESSAEDPEMDNLYGAYQAPGSEYWVVEKGGKVLGGGGFMRLKGGDKTVCELQKMYFDNEHRGIGLGRKLLRLLLENMKKAGYRACYLETMQNMETARALYESEGFEKMNRPMGKTGHTICNSWYARML